MKFKGELSQWDQRRVEACDQALRDPARLEALHRTGLMNSPREEAFDRLARLAARVLKVPLTIISLVADNKQFFKAGYGLPPAYEEGREVPIDESICRYTLTGEPLIAGDTRVDQFLSIHPTTEPWGIGAFIALPMILPSGHVLGAFCAVDNRARPWSDDDVAIMKDLTASVMTEIELRNQVLDLQIEREVREKFVATLSHDLRTPLGVTKMCAELLTDDQSGVADRQKLVTMMAENLDRADQMIRDLLDISLIKAGEKIHLALQPCDLLEIAHSTIASLTKLHGPRILLKSSVDLRGFWDPQALRRILENLVSNAVKYGVPQTPVTIRLSSSGPRVSLAVHNEGPPLDSKVAEILFEPFRRSESAKKSAQRGWGIGLTLVRGFAQAHGGSATVQSVSDGTTFTVNLPRDSRTVALKSSPVSPQSGFQ